jgi:hypothetical protein
MLINLTEVVEDQMSKTYTLREVTINPSHVVAVREDSNAKNALHEGRMTEGLRKDQQFSRLVIGAGQYGMNIVVVGSPLMIQEKLNNTKTLLKG